MKYIACLDCHVVQPATDQPMRPESCAWCQSLRVIPSREYWNHPEKLNRWPRKRR